MTDKTRSSLTHFSSYIHLRLNKKITGNACSMHLRGSEMNPTPVEKIMERRRSMDSYA